jgi:tetratricopeptide (TPR) repeat protein
MLLVGLGIWLGLRQYSRHMIVAKHVPYVPDLAAFPAALTDNIAEAEAQSRHWREALQGLGTLAALYHANGLYPEALSCYRGLSLIEPSNARWPYFIASIAASYGRMDEALPLFQRAVELAPEYLPARLCLAEALFKLNRVPEAVSAYTKVLQREAGNPDALLGLARCDLVTGDRSKARERLRKALTQNPDFVGGIALLATVNEQAGDTVAANALRQRISHRQPASPPDAWMDELYEWCFDPYRLSVAAAIANSAGNRARGMELAERAVALAPGRASYRRTAAQIMLAAGNPAGARRHLEEAVKSEPGDSDAWLLLIEALRGLGQDQAEQAALQLGLVHCPESGGLHLARAQALASARRVPEAIVEFKLSAALSPHDPAPLVQMADLCFASGQAETGLDALHAALGRQPGNPLALTSLMFYHVVTGDEVSALQQWQEIRNQPRTPSVLLDRLREAYHQQFKRDLR